MQPAIEILTREVLFEKAPFEIRKINGTCFKVRYGTLKDVDCDMIEIYKELYTQEGFYFVVDGKYQNHLLLKTINSVTRLARSNKLKQ